MVHSRHPRTVRKRRTIYPNITIYSPIVTILFFFFFNFVLWLWKWQFTVHAVLSPVTLSTNPITIVSTPLWSVTGKSGTVWSRHGRRGHSSLQEHLELKMCFCVLLLPIHFFLCQTVLTKSLINSCARPQCGLQRCLTSAGQHCLWCAIFCKTLGAVKVLIITFYVYFLFYLIFFFAQEQNCHSHFFKFKTPLIIVLIS